MSHSATSNPHPIHLYAMMERLGLDPGGGVVPRLALSYATAVHRCEACPSGGECRDWLDGVPQAVAFAPRFCPCADILFELQVDEPWISRTPASGEPSSERHAYASDLDRLEEELEELLLQKPADDPAVADLKRRKSRLQHESDWVRHHPARGGAPLIRSGMAKP